MTDPKCPICFGIGWVCENHPEKAWDEDLGCRHLVSIVGPNCVH
jgi:hypothetical protein